VAIDVEVLLYALLVITVVDRLGSPYSLEKWLTEVLEEDQSYTDMGAAWKPAANRFPPRGTVNMLMGDAILIQSESELRDIAAVLRDYGGLPVAPCIVTLRNYNVSVKLGKVTGPQLNVKLKARPRHLSALVQIARLLRSKDGELRRALAAAGDVSMRVDTSPSKTELKRHCAALETDNKKLRRSKAAAASRSSAMRSTLSETKIEAREQGREEWCNNLEPALRAALDADVQLVRARELKNDACKRARGAEAATAEATLRAGFNRSTSTRSTILRRASPSFFARTRRSSTWRSRRSSPRPRGSTSSRSRSPSASRASAGPTSRRRGRARAPPSP
jgi:hypothetical protein